MVPASADVSKRAFVIVPLLEIMQDIKQTHFTFTVEEMKRREGVTVMEAEKWGRRTSCFSKTKRLYARRFAKN